ncbi:MAG: hypothetical protein PVH29_12280 [Candidatus Zixiibacteriota bacterium]
MTERFDGRRGWIPRWACWAFLGIVVLAGIPACDGTTEPEPVESGYLYVAGYLEACFGMDRFLAQTGEERTVFPDTQTFISADIEPNTGDIFGYTWNFLYRYSAEGEEKFKVQVWTERYEGREYIAYNKVTGLIYFLNGKGWLYRFRSGNGEEVSYLRATGMKDAEQLLIDEDDNTLWIVSRFGAELGKYDEAGDNLFVLTAGPYSGVRVEPEFNTVIVGVIRNGSNYLCRYTKNGGKVKEIPTGIEPKYLGVEPASGVIWVSDGDAIERYAADGAKLDGISTAGFEYIAFAPGGATAFMGSPDGYITALNTRNLNDVWREQRYGTTNDIHLFKYNKK